MAKKVYAVKAGRKPGIYNTWDEAKAQVDGFAGAKYKGFTSIAEAEAFMAGSEVAATAPAKAVTNDIVDSKTALENLKKVTIGKTISILSPQVKAVCADKKALISKALSEASESPITLEEMLENPDVDTLKSRYGIDLSGFSFDENFAFVDGGGDKVGPNFESTRILFGAVIYDATKSEFVLYRYALEKGTEFDWLFRASNVAGEELAALLAMYVAYKRGLKQISIYQDNNLPAKYFSGAFKKINNEDDYALMIFIRESIACLEAGLDINFLYVPSEHASFKDKAKAAKGKAVYESQNIKKVTFEEAEFFNGVSDRLADYKI